MNPQLTILQRHQTKTEPMTLYGQKQDNQENKNISLSYRRFSRNIGPSCCQIKTVTFQNFETNNLAKCQKIVK